MSLRMISRMGMGVVLAAGSLGAASQAHATFFSFASDVNSNAYTLAGTAGAAGAFSITDFSRPNTFTLVIDDNNGATPSINVPVEFRAAITANSGQSTQIVGTLWRHSYRVTGTFGFYNSMGQALLTVNIGPNNAGVLTVPGTQTSWGTSGAVLGADSYADVTYTATSALVTAMGGAAIAAQYGINVGAGGSATSIGPDDFGFTMSVLNSGSVGAGIGIDATTKAPLAAWRSESSYSGSSFIPTPGSVALIGAAGAFFAIRRRR